MLNPKGHKKSTTLLFPNDSSSSCKSSTLSIYSQSYALATKKWKICEKVEMVTSSVENLINDQGETVIRLLKVAFSRGKKSSKANKWCLRFSAKRLTRWVWKELSVNLSLKSRGKNCLTSLLSFTRWSTKKQSFKRGEMQMNDFKKKKRFFFSHYVLAQSEMYWSD